MGKALELLGQRFGRLLVIKKINRRKNGCVVWGCQCDCGNYVEVIGTSLKNGNTRSCGCLSKENLSKYNEQQSEQSKITIGTRFGYLTVVEDLGFKPHVKGHNRRTYLCQCDCGNTCKASGNQLLTGHKISCGCLLSKGELIIKTLLEEYNIAFDYDTIFPQLLSETRRRLRFDFIIYNDDGSINRFIEFDGDQHKYGMQGGNWSHTETLDIIQERDLIKNQFCLDHNYILIRLPYYKIKNLTIKDLMTSLYQVKE
jgi:hypothetical protein